MGGGNEGGGGRRRGGVVCRKEGDLKMRWEVFTSWGN